MTFTFRKALLENVGLLIGLAGGTGSGKTFSAFRLAAGISGDKRFCVIDTEAGRAKHYADQFAFDHGDLAPPFSPARYAEAIAAADKAGYPVIVVDSMSHEHAGEGGILDMHDAELDEMVARALKRQGETRPEWQLRESFKMAAWIRPKTTHKAMVQRLLQVRAHLVLCFRAEEKIEMVRDEKTKRMEIKKKESLTGINGWIPVSEKNLPFELTASFLLTADAPGIPKPIKLQQQHRELFPLDKPITEESGRKLAAWASGGTPKAAAQTPGSARAGADALPASLATSAPAAPKAAAPATPSLVESADRAPVTPPDAAAPSSDLQAFIDGDIDVDPETGEIVTPPAAPRVFRFPFTLPGKDAPELTAASADEWFAAWAGMCATIEKSDKLSAVTKESKIRALRKVNEDVIKQIGGGFSARLHADLAERVKRLQAVAEAK